MQPQRFLVPLFQRPYVWSQERQWEPLWKDLIRVTERSLNNPLSTQPHFLGAIVLQQIQTVTSDLQQRSVIDGQQRLTTLQIMLDAIHAEIHGLGQQSSAARLLMLVENPEAYRQSPEDRYKVWPTNRDRDAFNEVMAASTPVDYSTLKSKTHRLVEAHRYFARECREWITSEGEDSVPNRAEHLERAARELLQIVVIDLAADENAQEIFETLNARGTPLTAADLIKNFIFQQLLEEQSDVESAYRKHWRQFETSFWEKEVRIGRAKSPRSAGFLGQWLVAETGQEISPKEVFSRFKVFADFDNDRPMAVLLEDIHRTSKMYEAFVKEAAQLDGELSRLGLFVYRTQAMESEAVKPLLLAMLDHNQGTPAQEVFERVLNVVESWLARRMLVKATTKSYSTLMANLVSIVRHAEPSKLAEEIERYLSEQTSESTYWPDDDEVRNSLEAMPIYRKLSRGRLRMVLEAIEDHFRGWSTAKGSLSAMRIKRNTFHIEHLMPQSWHASWPLPSGLEEFERDQHVHRLGNLTLLSQKLNSKVSNGPWAGEHGKVLKLKENDVLLMNAKLVDYNSASWGEAEINERTKTLTEAVLSIWSVPIGHKVRIAIERKQTIHATDLVDLLNDGIVVVGQTLYSQQGLYSGHEAEILPNGQVEYQNTSYSSLSAAGKAVRAKSTNGWTFWCIDKDGDVSMRDIRRDYVDSMGIDDSDIDDEN
jgi:Protein of unknown function DUF262/Protein of unknown function (DUF1524)/Restriction Enzyme Adenine Methylase Associated